MSVDPCYSQRLDEAIALAVQAFRHKRRKGRTVPYLTHLLAVTALAGEAGADEDQLIAAVLHDYVEDIDVATLDEVETRFGLRVRNLVHALSDALSRPKPPWRPRKEKYVAHLRHQPAEVKLISAADKLHNCQTLVRDVRIEGPGTMERFRGGVDGTLWYYRAVAEALAHDFEHWIVEELQATVDELHRLAGA